MTTFLILSYSALALFLGVYADLRDVVEWTLQIFCFYILCCFVDGIIGLFALQRTAARRESRNLTLHPITWVGRHFQAYQEVINYRINSFSDHAESQAPQPEIVSPEPTAENEASFFEQTLTELNNSFSPSSCAVLLQDKSGGPLKVYIKGIRGRRLEEQLKKIFADWFTSDDVNWMGLRDTFHHDFVSEEISAFGLRYLVASSFERDENKGIIWLGFASKKEPSPWVPTRLDDFAGKLRRELATFSNVQELRSRAVEAEKVSEARSEFLTHVSHDIKSPLNNVKAILTLLREEKEFSIENLSMLEAALRNCDSVAELVDSLVDFAKFRSGKLAARKSVFNVAVLLDEVAHSFEHAAKAKGLTFSFISPVGEALCLADKSQLRRIFSNLVSNAVKYTAEGTITLSITARDEHSWLLRIADTGPGFSAEQQREMFTPFTRFDALGIEGVGLGLTVSKILAELNGGSLALSASSAAGSEFSMVLPAARSVGLSQGAKEDKIIDFATAVQHASQQRKPKRLDGLRLLVVDDDPDATQGLSRLLAKEGADIAQATTVPDAISIMNFDQPDVLITDAHMPEGGGRRLIKFVRLNMPQTAVVIVTGDVSTSDELIALGAACVMDKPVHISELIDYLEDILRSGQQRAAGQ